MQGNSKEFVMYEGFDELPEELREKFKSGASGSNLSRAKNAFVGFINLLDKRGDELVGDYVGASAKMQVRFNKCGHVVEIRPSDYKTGRDCGVCNGKQVQQGVNNLATTHPQLVKEWHPTKNGKLTPYNVTHGSDKKVWWRCKHGHEWKIKVNHRVCMGSDCPYCSNKKVLKGYNDIATTHPQYVKYFTNIEDIYIYTYSSGKKVDLKCPNCSHVKIMTINKLTQRGFSCDICSDGISYPEKLMAFVLKRLNISFIKQLSYDSGKHKYDFYLPKYNAIIETHGLQHYEQGGFKKFGVTLEEERANDKHKREMAIANGIKTEDYHEIDCRYSFLKWCRPNIEKALSNYVSMSILTEEDWEQADIQAQKSLKIEVCKYWRDNKELDSELTPKQVAEVFDVGKDSIRNYLKWGNTHGFCSYDAKEEKETNFRRISTFVYLIKPNGDKWFDEPMSMNKLRQITGISVITINKCLDRGALKCAHNSKYDAKYTGSRIVSAEVYDNQTQAS